ncbi:MAG: hypothetical protein JW712_11525 [Dehalococcoidales bacterium]|nr:hypothetical protein [Dehalococcoidales bacterium]
MDEPNEKELWDSIDTLRDQLQEQWARVDAVYKDMVNQTDEDEKKEKALLYHEAIEQANQMEQDICDLLDGFGG